MNRILRRLSLLHHKLRYWLDSQTTEMLGTMAFAAMLFLWGLMRYWEAVTR